MNRINSVYAPGSAFLALESGIMGILQGKPMTLQKYSELYTLCFNMCTDINLGLRNEAVVGDRSDLGIVSGNHRNSQQILLLLQDTLRIFLQEFLTANGAKDSILADYTEAWQNYNFSAKVINGVCRYLNRFNASPANGQQVFQSALRVWKDTIFNVLSQKVSEGIFKALKEDREVGGLASGNGHMVALGIRSFIDLGHCARATDPDANSSISDLQLYVDHFENSYLESTRSYYEALSAAFIADSSNSALQYVGKSEEWIRAEEHRSVLYLHPTTKEKVEGALVEVLIQNRFDLITGEFKRILGAVWALENQESPKETENMKAVYSLVSRVSERVQDFSKLFTGHVIEETVGKINLVLEQAERNPGALINIFLDSCRKYERLIQDAFHGDPAFKLALERAAAAFVNKNPFSA